MRPHDSLETAGRSICLLPTRHSKVYFSFLSRIAIKEVPSSFCGIISHREASRSTLLIAVERESKPDEIMPCSSRFPMSHSFRTASVGTNGKPQ